MIEARSDYLHHLDKINGREPPVRGANNGSKDSGHGENTQAGKSASLGNFIAGIANAFN